MTIKKLQRSATTVSISVFHENNQLLKYNFEPPYQRRSVWTDEKQSYFIDSILRNFPIPPIFLHRKIDSGTGKTTFDVIDGKQRLTAIARFINNEIPAANEYGPAEEPNALEGAYFNDLIENESLAEFRSAFWKYDLSVEYIDPTDIGLIEDVFDRLNRNGEPLKGQELRNAQYHSSTLLKAVDELLAQPYLKERLVVTDLARMEDKEFASECLLTILIGQVIGSNQTTLDKLYEEHKAVDFTEAVKLSTTICGDLESLNLDYQGRRIGGVSHLYGLWTLAMVLRSHGKSAADYKNQIYEFYLHLRDPAKDDIRDEYKKSMNSRTKERFMRVKRLNALLSACGEPGLTVA
jgi:Protein of unknown function DUF262